MFDYVVIIDCLQKATQELFNHKRFLIFMIALIVTIVIDISFVKVNDLIDKYLIPIQSKLLLFSLNSFFCLILQFLTIRQIGKFLAIDPSYSILQARYFHLISLISLCILAALIGFLVVQEFYSQYYFTLISALIIAVSYSTAGIFLIWLSLLFFSWYRSSRNIIVLLYSISMVVIALNLILTSIWADVKLGALPYRIGEYVGSSGDVSTGRFLVLSDIYRISSFFSFLCIWITTALLMKSYKERLFNTLAYWALLSIPLAYFAFTYFYQYLAGSLINSYLLVDPVTISIVLGAFLSLSKPIGGLMFGISFWKISRLISYEKNVRTFMIISGWGIFLIFAANQAATQIVSPYPPFGIVTITVLNLGAYLTLLGIYNSARLVSANNILRKSIVKHTLESRLLHAIGSAEMEKELQKTVSKIMQRQESSEREKEVGIELDESELKKYIDLVLREVKKDYHKPDPNGSE